MSQATQLSRADFDFYIETFLARWENTNTQVAYRSDLVMWLRWCDEHNQDPLYGITRPLIELWMRWLRDDRKNSPSTINHRVGTLSQLFDLAADDDLVVKNPCRLVRRPRAGGDPGDRIALTRDEMQRLSGAARRSGPADLALVLLMGHMGLRVSEACGLDVEDCAVITEAHRCVRFVGKGGKPALIPLPPVVQRAVDDAAAARSTGPLLVRRDGSRMTRRSADRVVKRLAKTARITGVSVSPHTLRHTFVVGALDAGAPPRTVQLSARHADLSTTLRCYDRGRHVLDDHAAYVVAGYFSSGS
ncbi:tyrosine-type recombinase/integrase [Gordonia sp. HS-NH1]|uniref:tyrosine-type recombinase/integrase n=1 Tax=Gordonia sp. HS-NH1 TaxID=1435068 RepID=UPI000AD22048|nr:tyrosine-type recombinase/integrase [Gordonia sp. HS-NH1]